MINVSSYEITLKPKTNINLPRDNKGKVFRGKFGEKYKKSVCVKDFNYKCKSCEFLQKCPYPIVFESFPPENSKFLSKNSDIPRPFIIKPPLSKKTEYNKDDTIKFSLILVDKVSQLLPYFIGTFKELGIKGINNNDGKFDIISILNNNKEILHNGILQNYSEPVEIDGKQNISRIKLQFLTETTIKDKGEILLKPDFPSLIKRLRDRVSSLSLFYGEPWNVDFKQMGLESEKVIKTYDDTYWNLKSRFSKRNNVHHDMSGFMGEVVFEGDISPFMTLLQLGEYIHVGKGTVFGNGWYKIIELN